ncbi:MAG TPA: capsule assembly Wzi family protein [Longimicrobium sp.]
MIVRHTPLLRALGATLLLAAPLAAQAPAPLDVRGEVFVGSELEGYLRVLQVAGRGGKYPWAIRGFSPREVSRLAPADSAHAWARRYSFARDSAGGARLRLVRPQAQAIANSTMPFGANDGALWAGRGLTVAADAGVSLELGALSLTVAPMVFLAQNAAFDLDDNGGTGSLRFADGEDPLLIDLPQRFGDEPYGRVDPGQSTLRLDAGIFAAGVSTANQHWGPAADLPLILGHNAGGFPHLFVGSARPVNLGIARLHGRFVWGRLDQSRYTINPEPRRFMSGAVAVITPRGIPTLEVGGTRFFNTSWPADGLSASNFAKPLEGFLKFDLGGGEIDGGDFDNQLASVFFRWYHPRNGVELYGELAREDHNADRRDLLLEPDHNSGYTLGARRVWSRADGSLVSLRGELMNARVTHLALIRPQVPFYTHFAARQGHTQRGQLLGASSGYAGGGSVVALDRYTRRGRTSLTFTRTLRDYGTPYSTVAGAEPGTEVTQALGVEALRFMGRFDVTAGLTGAYQLDRLAGGDRFNLNTVLRVRLGL